MKVSIVSCVFTPEPYNVSSNIHDLARELTSRGHSVTVICPHPNRPFGRLMDGFQSGWCNRYEQEGFRILRCWHLISKKSTYQSRFLENMSFGIVSTWRLLRETRPDIVYLFNWTIFAEGLNSMLLHFLRIPVVSCTRDIYPELLFALANKPPRSWLRPTLFYLNKKHFRRCCHLVVLDEGMAEHLSKTRELSPENVSIVPVWEANSHVQVSNSHRKEIRNHMSVASNQLWAVYAGSIGIAPGLELYIQAAERLKQRRDIKIQIVGNGSMSSILCHKIHDLGLTNISVTDNASMSNSQFLDVQSAADVLLLPLPETMLNLCAPSKLVTYLMSGRPIIASVGEKSGTGQTIEKANAGVVLPSGDADSLANTLVEFADNPSLLDGMGSAAKYYAENNLSSSHLVQKLADLLESVAESSFTTAHKTRRETRLNSLF